MDVGEIITLTAIMIGLVAILVGIVAIIWQMHSQSNRLDAEIRAQGDRLDAEIRTQSAEIRAQNAKIDAQNGRLSETEREQARLEGVNSVLRLHSHTHEVRTHEADD